jgi:hypothetical protein
LKVVAALAVAKLTGFYYLYQLRDSKWKKAIDMIAPWIASLLVAFAIVFAFIVMGSPFEQRQLRLDDRRIQDLQSIQYQVINFWQQKEKLPVSLDELKNPISNYMVPQDPEFEKGISYEYRKISDKTTKANPSFELCATFTLPIPKGYVENSSGSYGVMPARDIAVSTMPTPYPGGMNDSWDHQTGKTCFERTIDPDLYPPYPKPLKQ